MTIENGKVRDGVLYASLNGRIDTTNAPEAEAELTRLTEEGSPAAAELDASALEFISSAGLRVLLRLRKTCPEVTVSNVSPEVYDIFEMTGFTEMMKVRKAFRTMSVEGCEVIGQGAKGTVYRLDDETIVKVYNDPDSLADIQHEREVAREALVLGIPTAISYDVVRCGDGYASVFELLKAKSFSKLIAEDEEHPDRYVALYTDFLKKIHGTEVPEGKLPPMGPVYEGYVADLEGQLPDKLWKKLRDMTAAIPPSCRMLHGDFHTKNLMMQDGEVLLIDMDTLSVGDPVFEFAQIYLSFVGYQEGTEGDFDEFIGFRKSTGRAVWEKVCRLYWEGASEEEIAERQARAMTLGYARLLRRILRKTPDDTKRLDDVRNKLEKLIGRVDSLSLAGD